MNKPLRIFVTGPGGAGKTIATRALGYAIPGAALVDLEHRRSLPSAISHPIRELDDWITLHDRLAESGIGDDMALVIGFPEFWTQPADSLRLGLEAMRLLGCRPAWVVGRPGSAAGLAQALAEHGDELRDGLVIRNRFFGLREYLTAPVRTGLAEIGWSEVDLPALHQSLIDLPDWTGHLMSRLMVGQLKGVIK